MRTRSLSFTLAAALALSACGGDESDPDPNTPVDAGVPVPTLPPTVDAPPLNPGWALMAGDIEDDWGLDVATDAEGNAYVVGFFQNAIDFGGAPLMGGRSAFMASFAADGSHRWSRAFSGQGSSEAWGVDEADGFVYVTGEAGGEVDFGLGATTGQDAGFVASLDATTGVTVWAERFAVDGRVEARGVAATGSAVYVVGVFEGMGDLFGASLSSVGVTDVLVVAFDSSGNGLWARGFGSEGVDDATAVALTIDEGPIVVGRVDGAVDFGGGALGQGETAFIVSLAADGSHQWSVGMESPSLARASDIAVDAAGNTYVTGEFRERLDLGSKVLPAKGGSDVLLASFDSAGELRFAWNFGDVKNPAPDAGPTYQNGIDGGRGVTVGADGNVYLTGSFQLSIDFGGGPFTYVGGEGDTDIFVASFDSDGNHRWSRPFGGDRGETGWAIAATPSGQAFVTGRSLNDLDVGTGALTNAGEDDVFVIRLDP